MTEELFRENAALLECEATVLAVDEHGIVLDRTVFYPLGGGQAGDAGTLMVIHLDANVGEVAAAVASAARAGTGALAALADQTGAEHRFSVTISDTRKHPGRPGCITHVLAPGADVAAVSAALPPGTHVLARIDAARRQAHKRFHTATHLLCALVPHPVDGCSITATYARLDFHMTEALDKDGLTAGIARLVNEAHPVSHRWISEAELDANPSLVRSMSVLPPRGLGRIRVLDIEGVDLQPCGGTHVANTTEVGAVVVTKIEKKSAQTRRVVLGFGMAD
jgi:misacylated tRNA(Ala) deacylase